MKKRKRALSLFEVTIGLVLTAILLTALFSSFRQSVAINRKVRTMTETLHPYFMMQMRLAQVFENISREVKFRLIEGERGRSTELIFSFHNRLDPETTFVGDVEGMLFCKEGRFSLALKVKGGRREELLLKGVKDLSIECFDPKTKRWLKNWKGKDLLPPMIRLRIDGEMYAFSLLHADRKVVL